MAKYIVVSLDKYNNFDPYGGMLEFAMENGNPVPGSLRSCHYDLPDSVKRNIKFWADGSMDGRKFRNIELKADLGMLWFVTDSHRILCRSDFFDTLYTGSQFAGDSAL